MLVYVDVDGVVADLMQSWLNKYNQDYNDNMTQANITEWDFHKLVKRQCGYKIYNYLKDPDIYFEAPVIDGAVQGIEALKSMGYRVVFLTAGVYRTKYDWLVKNRFLHDEGDIVFARDKSLVMPALLIDDRYDNKNGFSKFILFDQPWNREYDYKYRAHGWSEVIPMVRATHELS